MRGSVTPELAQVMARLAGFEFTLERCAKIAPGVTWLMTQAEQLDGPWLMGEEPFTGWHNPLPLSHPSKPIS
jgi:hypothetical protein